MNARKPAIQNSLEINQIQPIARDEIFLDDRTLATRWGCSPKTLRNQRSLGKGCRFTRLGRLVRYRLSDVLAFEAGTGGSR